MKAQRRHELHQNVLAEWLGKQLEVIKPYTNWILGGIIALCAVAIVVQLITGRSTATSATAWTEYYTALAISDPEKKAENLAKLETGSAGLWVHLSEGDLKLEQATAKIYTERAKAQELLNAAKKHFQTVEEGARKQPMLLQRAQYGLAQAYETSEEFDKAKLAYSNLIKDYPESVFGKAASRRLKRLDSTDLKNFTARLAAHKPSAIKKPSPGLQGMPGMSGLGGLGGLGGFGGNMPDFGAPLPERPDLSLPGPSLDFPAFDDEKKPGDSEKKSDDGEKEPADPKKPDNGETKTDEPEKKADGEGKQPAADNPAAPKKPGEPEKTPADEKP